MKKSYIEELIKNNPHMKDTDIACIFSKLLHGILAQQEKDINHCELKPQNLLFRSNLKEEMVKDFGFDQTEQSNLITPNFDGGNLEYCSPEQLLDGRVILESKLHECGALVYHMCGFHDFKKKVDFENGIFPSIEGDDKKQQLLNIARMLMESDPNKREDPKIILDMLSEEFPSSKQV